MLTNIDTRLFRHEAGNGRHRYPVGKGRHESLGNWDMGRAEAYEPHDCSNYYSIAIDQESELHINRTYEKIAIHFSIGYIPVCV